MTKSVPKEIHGSILQFLPLKSIPLIAKTHHILPEIFLSYHRLDNFLDSIYITSGLGLSDDQLKAMLHNTSYQKESILLYAIKSYRYYTCEYILKNNTIDFTKIHEGIINSITSFFGTILHLLVDHGYDPNTKELVDKLIKTKNTGVLKHMIENGKINACDHDEGVLRALWDGLSDVVRCFVKAGLDPSFDDNKLMKEAIGFSNYATVRFLLKQKPVSSTLNIERALERACVGSSYQNYLIAKKLSKWTNPSFNNNSCLSKAARIGNYETVKMLLSFKEVNPADNDNYVITIASKHISVSMVKLLLLDRRVNPRARNNLALRRACVKGNYGIVRTLLNWRGANGERVDPNDGTNGNSALRSASQYGDIQIVKLLLSDKRVNPGDNKGVSLRVALIHSREEVAIELLKWRSLDGKRVVPHWSTLRSEDQNPIVIACRRNLLKVFKILIKDPGVCLHPNIIAQAYKCPEILKILLSTPGISPSVNNNECLHRAISEYQHTSIRLLLRDPRTNVNDNNGELLLKAIKIISKDDIKKRIGIVEILLLHPKTEIYTSHLSAMIPKKEYTIGTSELVDRIFKIDPMGKRGLYIIHAIRLKNMGALRVMCKHPNFDFAKIVPDPYMQATYLNYKEAIDILHKHARVDTVKYNGEVLTWGTFRTLLKENNIKVSGQRAGELWREYSEKRVHIYYYTTRFINRIKRSL